MYMHIIVHMYMYVPLGVPVCKLQSSRLHCCSTPSVLVLQSYSSYLRAVYMCPGIQPLCIHVHVYMHIVHVYMYTVHVYTGECVYMC